MQYGKKSISKGFCSWQRVFNECLILRNVLLEEGNPNMDRDIVPASFD